MCLRRHVALVLLLLTTLSYWQPLRGDTTTVHRWYSPAGTGDGSSKKLATQFSPDGFDAWIQAQPRSATNIVLHFLPGVHENVRIFIGGYRIPTTGGGPWSFTNLNVYIQGGDPDASPRSRPEDTTLVFPSNFKAESANEGVIFVRYAEDVVGKAGGRLTQARRVVVENLALDCNWTNQRAFSDPGAPGIFKMFGVNATASTGRFRNVIVRNLGAHGLVPASQFDNKAGTEAFPIMANAVDEGQEPTADCANCDLQLIPFGASQDPRPWVIEGCEIHGFSQVWGGYNSAIMINAVNRCTTEREQGEWVNHLVHPAFFNDPQRRFALVRDCQVRGGVYAFGQAGQGWCTGSTFTGNAAVGAAGGYNADTHAVVAGDITNSVILDASVGVRQVTEGYGLPVSINNHTVAGNLIRLGSRSTYRRYQDYRTVGSSTAPTEYRSDSSLVLGYNFTNTASCFHINGTTLNPVFRDNWITTRSREIFYTPNRLDLQSAVFRLIWCQSPTEAFAPYESGTIQRPDSQNVGITNNRVSTESDNFVGMNTNTTLIAGSGVYPRFNSGTLPSYTASRDAIEANPNPSTGWPAFVSHGKLERVLMFRDQTVSTDYSWKRLTSSGTVETITRLVPGEPILTAVGEVQITDPVRTIDEETGLDKMVFMVRLVKHHLPASTTVGSGACAPQSSLRIVVNGLNAATVQTTSLSEGFRVVSIPIDNPSANGFDTITAYWNSSNDWGDPDLGSGQYASPSAYEYRCAITSTIFRHNTVVDLSVTPDVANDRNTAFVAQRPVFTIRRSGPTTYPLTVNLELPPYTVPRFSSSGALTTLEPDVAGTYGPGPGQDYVLKLGSTTQAVGPLPKRAFSVTIPANQSAISLTLVPNYDDLTENEVAHMRVVAGTGYAVGPESAALAFIYDGPEFVVRELTDPLAYSGASVGTGINGDASPAISGTINVVSGGYSGNRGGRWVSPYFQGYFSDMRNADYPGSTPEPWGVADTVGGETWYVGSRLNGSKRVPWRGWPGAVRDLATLKAGGSGEALAIANNVSDVRRIVGWTEHTYKIGEATNIYTTPRRPVMWSGTNLAAVDLGSLTSGGGISIEGAALAVNSLGSIGGWSKMQFSNPTTLTTRGFLMVSNRSSISSISDIRYPLGVNAGQDDGAIHSVVYGVEGSSDACGVSHESLPVDPKPTNAVVWRGSMTATSLMKPTQPFGSLVHADALIFTKPLYAGGLMRPVGRVWTNNISSAVAVLWNHDGVAPALLSDPHFTLGSGWIFRRPRSSNSSGWIVGEGSYNGVSRGFVMIRRN